MVIIFNFQSKQEEAKALRKRNIKVFNEILDNMPELSYKTTWSEAQQMLLESPKFVEDQDLQSKWIYLSFALSKKNQGGQREYELHVRVYINYHLVWGPADDIWGQSPWKTKICRVSKFILTQLLAISNLTYADLFISAPNSYIWNVLISIIKWVYRVSVHST